MTKVEDIVLDSFKASQLIPDWDATLIEHDPDCLPAGTPAGASEHVLLSVHTWVVREAGRIVQVDTGVGNGKSRPYAAYDAGLADMIAVSGSEPIPGFIFHSTPGHSIDHASIELRSGGETALFAGDVLHHPAQVFHPEWVSTFDAFPEHTLRSRHWALDFAAERDAIVFSSHFANSSAGKVSRHGKAYT